MHLHSHLIPVLFTSNVCLYYPGCSCDMTHDDLLGKCNAARLSFMAELRLGRGEGVRGIPLCRPPRRPDVIGRYFGLSLMGENFTGIGAGARTGAGCWMLMDAGTVVKDAGLGAISDSFSLCG